jgi:hypothetical protein
MKSTNPENQRLNLLIPLVTLISIISIALKMSIAIIDLLVTGQLGTLILETLSSVTIMLVPACLYILVFHWTKFNYLSRKKRLYATFKKCWPILFCLCFIPLFNYYLTMSGLFFIDIKIFH